jgi:hypothetical protein
MNRKVIVLSLIAVMLALATSFMLHQDNLVNLMFHFRSEASVRKDLERTIDQFNNLYASFYVTGGDSPALNYFPGSNLIKRRIYQDINLWQQKGQWLIHDLHDQKFKKTELISSGYAIVETIESWDMWLRDIKTGMKTGRKTNTIQVRYYLSRNRNTWIVGEFEVYGMDENIPPLFEESLL